MKRNSSIELYRVLLMLGVCVLHAMTMCGHNSGPIWGRFTYVLYSCVVGFVFISGWFGIDFKFRKLLRLWGVAFYAAFVAIVVSVWGGMGDWRLSVSDILRTNWFLNGYCVLMLLAPLVNLAVERRFYSPVCCLLTLVFGWAFLTTVPGIKHCVPRAAGVADYSGLTLVGIYALARVIRVEEVETWLSTKMRTLVFVVSLTAVFCHLSAYASPFAFGLAAMAFLFVKGVQIPIWLERIAIWMAPSMFAVFLIHSNRLGFGLMARMEDMLCQAGLPLELSLFLTGGIVFVVCFLMDCPRRIALAVVSSVRGKEEVDK